MFYNDTRHRRRVVALFCPAMVLSRNISIFIIILTLCIIVLLYQRRSTPRDNIEERLKFLQLPQSSGTTVQQKDLFASWRACILEKLTPIKGNHKEFWERIEPLTTLCNEPYASILGIKDYANSDETKHHISPLVTTPNNTIVTLGIGHDTGAEENLIKAIGKENLQFYGADPIQEVNMALYTKFGKFYPVAVSGKAGYSTANVLIGDNYKLSSVVYVDIVYFLTKMIGLKFFDDLWIDSEGGEYDFFPMLVKGGDFDQAGITLCQVNMEMHQPDDEKMKLIHDFMFKMLDDQRYAFFFPVNVGHLRVFFVNFSDEQCTKKYIPQEFDRSKLSR